MKKSIQVLCVAGARPNFMKLAPLFRAFGEAPEIRPTLVHTGQHYDDRLSSALIRELGLPEPKYNLGVGQNFNKDQFSEIMRCFEPVLIRENPDAVLVVGDVNSTAACALVARKRGFFVIHVEAGLRSFDLSMPEEINRIVTDRSSDLFLVSEESGKRNLENEGMPPAAIRMVGSLMIDSLRCHLPEAQKSGIRRELELRESKFGLVTLHRPANVDQPEHLTEMIAALREISAELPLVFPIHPRTRAHLTREDVGARITTCEPLAYIDFLYLLANSAVVLTDSGGIQEETTALGVPCLTLRNNTERPVTLEIGTNRLAGTTRRSILNAWRDLKVVLSAGRIPPLWDGQAAGRCVQAIRDALETRAGGAL